MSAKFEFIDAEYAASSSANDAQVPSIVKMCAWLEVSRSGFYEWRDRPTSMTAQRREELACYIQKSFGDSDGTYGYRRVHADLADWGIACGPELVRSIMRELGLEPCQPKPWRYCLTEADGMARRRCDLPLRPRKQLHLHPVCRDAEETEAPPIGRPHRHLLRQRDG